MSAGQKSFKESRNIHAGFYDAVVADVSAADFTVTLRDNTAKGVYISGDGDLAVVTPSGKTITYKALLAGFHPIPHKQILTAGTTIVDKATGIISGTW